MTPRWVRALIGLIVLAGAIGLFIDEDPLRSLIGLDLYYGTNHARYTIDQSGELMRNEQGEPIITIFSVHAPLRALNAHLISSGVLLLIAGGLFVWSFRTKPPSTSSSLSI